MYAQLSDNWRKIGNSLYQRQGNAFIHVAVCPPHIRSLKAAVTWYLNSDHMFEHLPF
ncbi:hypothetical protein [Rhizobium sp. LCM 4573]|uniref:hypothetical protein n=1 Tax=Rhizobium sp. LCM 4573 TaxID=1848291 RepID=UPI0012FF8FDA|nr:hypothetical protein [Rhizobium sp. LCM 4573]